MKNLHSIAFCLLAVLLAYCTPQSPSAETEGELDGVEVEVEYSSPRVRGREGKIWGDMLPYGQVWRAGANEATEVSFEQAVMVEGQRLEAGTYSLFMIPDESEWQVIFNRATDISGTDYESVKEQNALEVSVQPQKNTELREELSYEIENGKLLLHWEYLTIPIAVSAAN
ncbi:DUF2911 domain-containing protein [Porifericola rhodea]|uniref:DUF2911 domain-containing protein n=1 Tax=Porifericola rhodea TaxID=930972 RepID=UPI002665C3DC|nr:DUF2911 domain-containing protein [Porifericola rhodea]WKN33848.1 DUF2911 domain-containing protein [Porifericola rhodea]